MFSMQTSHFTVVFTMEVKRFKLAPGGHSSQKIIFPYTRKSNLCAKIYFQNMFSIQTYNFTIIFTIELEKLEIWTIVLDQIHLAVIPDKKILPGEFPSDRILSQ